MCNFDKQNENTKELLHQFMKNGAKILGGVNFLLNLIESIKTHKPTALIYNNKKISSNEAEIEWNKIIFKDKFDVLEELIRNNNQSDTFNILENQNIKKAKKILNMVKTLAPVEFVITSKLTNENNNFKFKIFDKIQEENVTINPVFIAIFFCSTEFIKKALKYNEDSLEK